MWSSSTAPVGRSGTRFVLSAAAVVAEAGTRRPRPAAGPASCFGVFTAPGRIGTGAADADGDTTLTRNAATVRLNAVESHRQKHR